MLGNQPFELQPSRSHARTVPVGFGALDRELRFLRVDSQLAAIHGLPAADHQGQMLSTILPSLAPVITPLLHHVLMSGAPILDADVRGELPDGRRCRWHACYYPVCTPTGSVIAVGCAVYAFDQRRPFSWLATSRATLHWEADYLEFQSSILASLHDSTVAVDVASGARCTASRHPWTTIIPRRSISMNTPMFYGQTGGQSPEEQQHAREHAERMLADERRQLDAIARTMHEGMVVFHPDGTIATINAAGLRLGGLQNARPPVPHGTPSRPMHLMPFDTQGHALPPDAWPANRVLRGEQFAGLELRVRPDGMETDRWLVFSGTPVYDDDGKLIMGVVIAQDITQRKQDEAALRAYVEALSRTNAELTRALRLKSEFLAMMSHELRTPLSVILGGSEILESEVHGPINVHQHRILDSITQSGHHLLTILTDILDLAYIESGHATLDCHPIDVDDLCHTAIQFVCAVAQQKGIRVQRSIDLGVKGLRADERRLTQILVNLLDNAVKFTPIGGVIGLEIHTDAEQECIKFVVWDTGIGIAEVDYAQIFQLFTQVDGLMSRRYGGVGLGLTLVRQLVELHGGSISLESTPGQGSRFTVSLPWVEGTIVAAPTVRERVPLPQPWTYPLRVVFADDHEPSLAAYVDMLTHQGGQIAIARTGEEAVAQVRATHPDVVVMDIQMPKMDGLTAIRHIRADPELAPVPIIALTALEMPGDRERCLATGANAYLTKPASLRTLLSTISTVVSPTILGNRATVD